MQIIVQGKNFVCKTFLPQKVDEKIWIKNQKDEKLFCVTFKNNNWYILNNRNTELINLKSNEKQSEILMQEYEIYLLQYLNSNQKIVIYCLPTYEDSMIHLEVIKPEKITIGNNAKCSLCYYSNLVSKHHATLYFEKGKWIVENYDRNIGIILNGSKSIAKRKILENGDSIIISGFKIVIVGKNIFINNPNNNVKCDSSIFKLQKDEIQYNKNEINIAESEEKQEYYSRMPRIIRNDIRRKLVVATPPGKNQKNGMPLVLTIGSTLSMGAISIITCVSSISGIVKGTSSLGENIASLSTSFIMLISMLLIPILTIRWERKTEKKNEERRQNKYRNYIYKKTQELEELKKEERKYLKNNYPSIQECESIILEKSNRLWERKITDYDFLSISFGYGTNKFQDVDEDRENFSVEQDDLIDLLEEFKNKARTIDNVPITISFIKEKIVGLIDENDQELEKILQAILIQLMAFQRYDDLKFVFMLKKDRLQDWKNLKMLPYVWDKYNTFRFLGTDYSDNLEDISTYLEKEFNIRKNKNEKGEEKPYYLIITDDYRNIEDLNITSNIIKNKENYGFGIFCIGNSMKDLPEQCKTFIKINGQTGKIIKSEGEPEEQKEFTIPECEPILFEEIAQTVSNIPIKPEQEEDNSFPENYSFLDMFKVNNIEALQIKDRWMKNDTITSIATPIGISETGKIIKLDIHEKAHGPHGLIAGSTGSR